MDSLPKSCEVAVVGAGITGLSVAHFLARDGVSSLIVIDREGVGAGASGVQPGGVRQQWSTRVNCLLAREAVGYYRELDSHLNSPLRPRLEECGYAFLAHSDAELARLSADVALQNEVGVPSVILTPEEAAEVVPDLRPDSVVGAAWCGEDAYVDLPQSVVEAFAQTVEKQGVTIHRAAVTALSADGDGWAVAVDDGRAIHADRVVLAAGVATSSLVGELGIDLPIRAEPRCLFLSEPIRDRLLDPLVVSAERAFAAKQLANGRVLASDLTPDGPGVDAAVRRQRIRDRIDELLPRLEYVSLPLVVDGIYDSTPDNQPIVDEVADGLWVSAGFSGHGFMMAPALGRRLAGAIAKRPVDELLAAFSTDRFSSNTPLTRESAIV